MNVKVYLDVPYNEKDEAKANHAFWDPNIKKWYYSGDVKYLYKVGKWILNDKSYKIIALDNLYIFEGKQECYRCHYMTKVIGLGLGQFIYFREIDNGRYHYEIFDKDNVYLSWVDSEQDIPPRILKFMKSNSEVKSTITKSQGPCFANHCENCGAVQGNNYIFNEPVTVFSPLIFDDDFIAKLRRITLYQISITDSLVLNWNFSINECSKKYLTFCNKKRLRFSNIIDLSYKDLYFPKV